jgi:hypothetical protein
MSANDASRELARETFTWRGLNLYSVQEWDECPSRPASAFSTTSDLICETATQANSSALQIEYYLCDETG